MATGKPPNAEAKVSDLRRILNQNPPRLNPSEFPEELCSFVSYILVTKASERPTMSDVMGHPYIAGTERDNPTASLADLVKNFTRWQAEGGYRHSLFNPFGAKAAEVQESVDEEVEWNFSTTAGFQERYGPANVDGGELGYDQGRDGPNPNSPFYTSAIQQPPTFHGDEGPSEMATPTQQDLTVRPSQEAETEQRVQRGASRLQDLFTPDLPLRTNNDTEMRRQWVPGPESSTGPVTTQALNLSNVANARANKQAKRATMEWSLAEAMAAAPQAGPSTASSPPSRPPLLHSATAPIPDRTSTGTLDLDALMGTGSVIPSPAPLPLSPTSSTPAPLASPAAPAPLPPSSAGLYYASSPGSSAGDVMET